MRYENACVGLAGLRCFVAEMDNEEKKEARKAGGGHPFYNEKSFLLRNGPFPFNPYSVAVLLFEGGGTGAIRSSK